MEINAMKGGAVVGGVVRAIRTDAARQVDIGSSPQASAENSLQPGAAQASLHKPLEVAVSSIQEFAQSIQRNLNFALDESTGRVVVKVTDSVSGEVIRQMPSEEALRLAETLDEVRSLLFKVEA